MDAALARLDVSDTQWRPLGRNGLKVGPYAFGVAPIANLGHEVSPEDARGALDAAWDEGVRYFDVAPHYGLGLGEQRLGEALGTRDREQFVVSTKVGRLLVANPDGAAADTDGFDVVSPLIRQRDYSRDGVLRSIDESLRRLDMDRLDIVFVHDPDDYYREALDGAFPALEELRSQGVIRSYGAGMNQSKMLADLIRNTDLDIVMCAGRYSLLEQGALYDLFPVAAERDVSVVSAGVFNSGILANVRPAATATYDYAPAPAELIERANRLADVCEEFGVPLPAAAVQFPLMQAQVSTVCVGARSASQVERNAGLFNVSIPDELWRELTERGLVRSDPTSSLSTQQIEE